MPSGVDVCTECMTPRPADPPLKPSAEVPAAIALPASRGSQLAALGCGGLTAVATFFVVGMSSWNRSPEGQLLTALLTASVVAVIVYIVVRALTS
jgi:hypothetical protein